MPTSFHGNGRLSEPVSACVLVWLDDEGGRRGWSTEGREEGIVIAQYQRWLGNGPLWGVICTNPMLSDINRPMQSAK